MIDVYKHGYRHECMYGCFLTAKQQQQQQQTKQIGHDEDEGRMRMYV